MVNKQNSVANLSLLTASTIWGLIWYPYRIIENAGVNGVIASVITYAVAFVIGLFVFRSDLRTGNSPPY